MPWNLKLNYHPPHPMGKRSNLEVEYVIDKHFFGDVYNIVLYKTDTTGLDGYYRFECGRITRKNNENVWWFESDGSRIWVGEMEEIMKIWKSIPKKGFEKLFILKTKEDEK